MDRAGPLLSMLVTTTLVAGGAVLGYLNHGTSSPITTMYIGAIGGLIVTVYVRVIFMRVIWPVWRRVTFTTQAGWMALQVGFTLLGLWLGVSVDLDPGETREFYVILGPAFGFAMGIAVTALWAWSYDLFRYGLPGLVAGAAQKVCRRKAV